MTDLPWVNLPPDVPDTSDAAIDSRDASENQGGDGADTRDQERNACINGEESLPDSVPPSPKSNLQDND